MADAEARTPTSDTSERSRPPLPLPPKPPRPQISLMIPPGGGGGGNLGLPLHAMSPPRPMSYYYDPRMMAGGPLTPEAVPISIPLELVTAAYPAKASEFMFKQFEGFRDFTMNTAKSGLSVGEKFSFWAYNKLRAWSRRWFTHIFLLLVIAAYSLAGAAIFVAVEGPEAERIHKQANEFNRNLHKTNLVLDINKTIESLGVDVRNATTKLKLDELSQEVTRFEQRLFDNVEAHKRKNWTYWESVFYCGTVFTTIGQCHHSPLY